MECSALCAIRLPWGQTAPLVLLFHLLSLTTPSALRPCTPFLVPHLHMVESFPPIR